MESFFKQKITQKFNFERKPTFAEAVYGLIEWGKVSSFIPDHKSLRTSFSEKSMVLESFNSFAEEKFVEEGKNRVTIGNVEITRKEHLLNDENWKSHFKTQKDWKSSYLENMAKEVVHFYQGSLPKVLVLCDSNRLMPQQPKSENQLYFEGAVLELWDKMLLALKLQPSDKWTFSVEVSSLDEIKEAIYWIEPQIILTLGAQAVQKLTGTKERLTSLHGQQMHYSLGKKQYSIIPLFHPSLLVNNLNMKKTTWSDMQKIIEILTAS
jgi:hypothetical protein